VQLVTVRVWGEAVVVSGLRERAWVNRGVDRYPEGMSPEPLAYGSVRSAAVVNEAIRAVVVGAQGRRWTVAERDLYGLLLEEWSAALRDEVVEAA
jgi:hypothetical protein